jgi:histidinol-phosphate aminotransferase
MIAPRRELAGIVPYAVPSREGLRLDLNEPRSCSPRVIEALRTLTPEDITTYPRYDDLIQTIASRMGIPPTSLLLTNGANEAIQAVMNAYIERGDTVILPTPTFGMYEIMARVRGAAIVSVPYNEDLSFPTHRVLAASGKLVVIVNPGSPTGTWLDKKTFTEILHKMDSSLIVLDETYAPFAGESFGDLIERFENLVLIRSFSKVYGLAGLRLGIIASAAGIIREVRKVIPPFSVNAAAVIAGNAAIDDTSHTQQALDTIQREKDVLYTQLAALGVRTHQTKTNFILIDLKAHAHSVWSALRENGIFAKNVSNLPRMEGYLRVTVGTHRENTIFLRVLKEVLPPEAVLFDIDGVLVDVSSSYRSAVQKTAEHFLNREIPLEEIEKYKAMEGYNNDWDLTAAIVASHGVMVPKEKIIEIFQQYYRGRRFDGLIRNERWLLDISLLEKLAARYRLGIVTGRPRREAVYTLTRFGVENYFDLLIALEDIKKDKPDPAGITAACRKLDITRGMYVGDTINDLSAARAAGVVPVIVTKNKELFRKKKIKYILKTVNELKEVLL